MDLEKFKQLAERQVAEIHKLLFVLLKIYDFLIVGQIYHFNNLQEASIKFYEQSSHSEDEKTSLKAQLTATNNKLAELNQIYLIYLQALASFGLNYAYPDHSVEDLQVLTLSFQQTVENYRSNLAELDKIWLEETKTITGLSGQTLEELLTSALSVKTPFTDYLRTYDEYLPVKLPALDLDMFHTWRRQTPETVSVNNQWPRQFQRFYKSGLVDLGVVLVHTLNDYFIYSETITEMTHRFHQADLN